jgi:hypothetical protein
VAPGDSGTKCIVITLLTVWQATHRVALASGEPQISRKIREVPMHQVMKASSSMALAACLLLAAGGSVRQANSQAASPALDYQFFKDKVQAVFLHKREGH